MSKLKYVHNNTQYVQEVERGLTEYLGNLWRLVDEEDYSDEFSLTGLFFCGCDDCTTRETIAYLLPLIIDGYKAGIFELNEEYKA